MSLCAVRMTDSVNASQGTEEALRTITKSKPVLVCPTMKTYDGLYYLSHLDESLVLDPIDVLFSFEMDGKRMTENLSETIKQALSKVLVHFYPFAGTLIQDPDGKFMVKCTGEGVSFVEAIANCDLNEFGYFTVPDHLPKHRQLLNVCNEPKNPFDIPLLPVQVTRFQCGGFVLGISTNHCMCDATSLMAFMKSWGELARGLPLSVPPVLDRSILKPRQLPLNNDNISAMEVDGSRFSPVGRDEQSVFKSFCFDTQKMMQLRKVALEDGTIKSATDFELIIAFIWCGRTKALKMNPAEPSKFVIVVDGRPRLGPSLPKGYFGNVIFPIYCECSAGELIERPLSLAIDLMKSAIELNYIQSLNDFIEATSKKLQLEKAFVGNKWSRLPSNDIDFGWGSPKQYSNASPLKEVVVYVTAQSKDSKNKILTLGLPSSNMKAFEEIMQSEMGMQALI